MVVEDDQTITRTWTRSRTWTVCDSQVVLLAGRVGGYLVKRCSVDDTRPARVFLDDPCEWNPEKDRPGAGHHQQGLGWYDYDGCQNQAALIVGADGKWRLCRSCAALPRFNRYRVRREIGRGAA